MAKTIAVCNQKGGVGKTTTTVNLGIGLARMNYKVLMIDADPQGDMTTCLGCINKDDMTVTFASLMREYTNDNEVDVKEAILHHEEGVDYIPSNIELSALEMQLVTAMSRERVMKNLINNVKDDYDYIVVDCMPSLGMITINALTAADSVIIPVQSQHLPAKGMMQLIQTINRVKKHINPELNIDGILITLVDKRDNLSKYITEKVREGFGEYLNIYDTVIPSGVAAAYASITGKSVFNFDRNSNVAHAYIQFVREYTGRDDYVLESVPISNIKNQGFGIYSSTSYRMLAMSISESGMREPVELARNADGELEIIDGWRRVKACELLGMDSIDARVYEVSPERAERLRLINGHSTDNDIDKNIMYKNNDMEREML